MTATPERPVRVGILGAARIAPIAMIGPARERRDVRIVAVAARDPDRARRFAADHGIEGWAASYRGLVEREDVDLVYIALPPNLHCEWTIAALEAGKSVLCEKPFALDEAQARSMVAAADLADGFLIEAFHYRFHRLMRRAVELVSGGAIGEPLWAKASTRYPIPVRDGEPRWSDAHGGGAVMDLGCYAVHALRALLPGEPEVTWAGARTARGVDASTAARLRFPGGLEAELDAVMDPREPFTEIVVEGTRGRIQYNGFILPQRAGRLHYVTGEEIGEAIADGPSSYAAQLDHAIAVWRGRESPITGSQDAIANMRLIDAIRARARARA